MKIKLVLVIALFMTLPVMAQTNSPVIVSVEVPSFTFDFPGTMTPSQINDVLKSHFAPGLIYTFEVTNKQNHRFIKFTGNTMPATCMDELKQSDATQLSKTIQTNSFLHVLPSQTLKNSRANFPQFNNYSDAEIVLAVGQKYPQWLKSDPAFAGEYLRYSAQFTHSRIKTPKDLTTIANIRGKTYRNVEIQHVDPDGLMVSYGEKGKGILRKKRGWLTVILSPK
ncbi:MAG: hypothetical protein PHY43_04440 [Verrucomicrobiales bacterium]|nr:hypothetical protein [Verrucomicrobiales bacterium]